MKVRYKLLLIVSLSVTLALLPTLGIIYFHAESSVLDSEIAALTLETNRLTTPAIQRFQESRVKLPALGYLVNQTLSAPFRDDEQANFDALLERFPDGVIRNRKPPFDGTREAGFFLPPGPGVDEQSISELLRIKKIFDVFGSAATRSFENVYFLGSNKSEIGMDRNNPDYMLQIPSDLDFTQTPWVQLNTPENNPERQVRFTTPLYDPVMKKWMVSALYPAWAGDRWMGSLGEDLLLDDVLAFMFESGQRYSDEQHHLVAADGTPILAGKWQSLLEAGDQGAIQAALAPETALRGALSRAVSPAASLVEADLLVDGRQYVAFGMKLEPVGWNYLRIVPRDQILASTRELFTTLILAIVVMGLGAGLAIYIATNLTVSRRIGQLAAALQRFGRGESVDPDTLPTGADEIANAAAEFTHMARELGIAMAENQRHLEELQDLNRTLEDKVTARTAELQRAHDSLVESKKLAALGELVAGVAHEINTPIGIGVTASSHLEELARHLGQTVKAETPAQSEWQGQLADIQQASAIIHRNLLRAGSLVSSFKQLSADQISEPRRRFAVGRYLEELLLTMSPVLKKAGIQARLDCPAELEFDSYPGAFSQIFSNLIMNCVNHAFDAGHSEPLITISVAAEPGAIQCTVRDNGKGIEAAILPRIFDPFFSTRRHAGGTGLGLSVVHNLASQKFHGTISCESTPGQGTCFRMRLCEEVRP